MAKVVLICLLVALAFSEIKAQGYGPPPHTQDCIRLGYEAAVLSEDCRSNETFQCALFCVRAHGARVDCVPDTRFCCCRRRPSYGTY